MGARSASEEVPRLRFGLPLLSASACRSTEHRNIFPPANAFALPFLHAPKKFPPAPSRYPCGIPERRRPGSPPEKVRVLSAPKCRAHEVHGDWPQAISRHVAKDSRAADAARSRRFYVRPPGDRRRLCAESIMGKTAGLFRVVVPIGSRFPSVLVRSR